MAWTYTESGNNTASTSWGITFPSASTGDLIIVNLAWDDSTNVTSVSAPSGPNGESFTNIQGPQASNGTANRGQCWYTVATGSWSAGNLTFTPNASEQWTATVIKVPTGEFDATTPIGASNYLASTTKGNPSLPSLTAGSSDGGGTVVGFISSDVDDADGTVSGWTTQVSTDRGAVAIDVVTRDTTATDSESISSASGWTYPSARSWVSFIYIVRAFVNDPPTVALNSPSDTGSTSDTTPDLTFTGTDGDSDDITYEVQVDTVNTFDSQGSAENALLLNDNGSLSRSPVSSSFSDISFFCWVQLVDRSTSNTIFMNGTSGGYGNGMSFYVKSSGSGNYLALDIAYITDLVSTLAITDSNWHFVGFTRRSSDSQWTIYLDSSSEDVGTTGPYSHDGNALNVIGGGNNEGTPTADYDGSIARVGFWGSLLSGANITSLYGGAEVSTIGSPLIDLPLNNSSAWGTNGGSGGNFTENGTLTEDTKGFNVLTADMEQGVADNAGGYVQTPTIQFSGNTTTGNTILISVTYNDDVTGNISSISDTTSNSYAKIAGGSSGGDTYTELWYAYNITGGTTPTITVTMSNANYHDFTITAREISGLTTTDPFDVKAEGSVSAGTSHTSATTATTSQANELVYSVIGLAGNTTYTAGSGFGDLSQTNGSDLYQSSASQMKVVSSVGTQSATITSANSLVGYFIVATFKIGGGPLIDALSDTDSGFSGTPDNTDPYTSGQSITYTVQSALDDDTYYWRVRGKDPGGTNTWSDWTTTRSFTVISGATTQTKTVSAKTRISSTGVTKTISAKSRIQKSDVTKTISSKSRIKKLVSQTVSAKLRVFSTGTTKTISSKVRILNTYTKTVTSKLRVLLTDINKTVQSKVRILKYQSSTISAKIRVLSTGVVKTISAKLRINLTDITKTVSVKTRIKKLIERTVSAKVMISSTGITKSISAKLRVLKLITQTVSSKSRILVAGITKTISSKSRILKLENRTVSSKTRVLSIGLIKTISTKLRVLNTYTATVQSKSRILITLEKTVSSKIRILTTGSTKTVSSKLRVLKNLTKTIQSKVRILKVVTANISAKTRVLGTIEKTVSAKVYILSTGNTKVVSAKVDIQKNTERQITSKTRILVVGLKTISARLRILSVLTKTISSKVRIKKLLEKTVSVKARILSTGTVKTISSLIRIKKEITASVSARIRILQGFTKTISAKVWVLTVISNSISARLRILKSIQRTATSKIRILSTGEIKTISSKVWILVVNTNTISALVSIRKVYTKTIRAKVRIRTSYTLNLNQLYSSDSQVIDKHKNIITKKSILNRLIKRMYKVR